MKHIVYILLALSLTACGEQSGGGSGKIEPISNSGQNEGYETPALGNGKFRLSECRNVSNLEFLDKVSGRWQQSIVGFHAPSCWSRPGENVISRHFYEINRAEQTFASYNATFTDSINRARDCLNAELEGLPTSEVLDLGAVELCQTNESVKIFGVEFYFLKNKSLYQMVGTSVDDQGRTVLLVSGLRANYPALPKDQFRIFINHNDLTSVKGVKLPEYMQAAGGAEVIGLWADALKKDARIIMNGRAL